MKKILIAASLLFSAMPAYALLSPLNQSIAEMRGILNSTEFTKYLPDTESIQMIHRIETGYLIFTHNYQMFVELQYIKQNRPGPRTFNLIFHAPTKLTSSQ